jgi:hypothetical protein
MPLAVSPEKLTARFVVMFPQVPETESTWLISERLEAATSVVGLKLAPPQLIQIEPGQGPYSQPNIMLVQNLQFPRIGGHIYLFRSLRPIPSKMANM